MRGKAASATEDAATVPLLVQSQRQRRASTGTQLARVRALAGDPHLYAMAAAVADANQRDHRLGGRPL